MQLDRKDFISDVIDKKNNHPTPNHSIKKMTRDKKSSRLGNLRKIINTCFSKHCFLTSASISLIFSVIIGIVLILIYPRANYQLSNAANLLLNKPLSSSSPISKVDFQNKTKSYEINISGLSQGSNSQTKLVGQPNTGLYSATLPLKMKQGITVYDDQNKLNISLVPNFETHQEKYISGRFIYPVNSNIQLVYTPQQTQLSEDIVINKPINSTSFSYQLILPTGLIAKQNSIGGGVGIYKKSTMLFELPAPVVKESNNSQDGQTVNNVAQFKLNNNTLTLNVNNIEKLHYPIVIDPSVLVNSAASFLTGNIEGDISTTPNQISEGGLSGGILNNTWGAANSLPQALYAATSVVYNGYVYELGGSYYNGSVYTYFSTVYYAPINSNGSLGAWVNDTASPLPQTIEYATSVVYNGYVYELGGYNGTTSLSTVYYAPINSNGSLGAWVNDTASPLPAIIEQATSVVYNGYVYELGGGGAVTYSTTVYYAPINSDGSLGSWVNDTASPLPRAVNSATSVVYNGYVYVLGGNSSGGPGTTLSTVYYAPINSDGSLGSWVNDTASPLPVSEAMSITDVFNGYIYEIGGIGGGSYVTTVYYAPINSDGSLGSWVNDTASPLPQTLASATSVVYNGYIYELGGNTSSLINIASTVYYSQVSGVGSLSPWITTTTLPSSSSKGKSYGPNDYASSVVYNGFVYEIGGMGTSGLTSQYVYYAPISSNGSLGAWTSTTSLPQATYYASSVVYNGYVYELGGVTTACTSTTYYAPINSNGSLGSWTSATSLPQVTCDATSVVYNGFVYEIGGSNGGATIYSSVYYAPISSNGSLGSWVNDTASPLPQTIDYATSVVYNGFVYEIGGNGASGSLSTVYYAPISSNGSLGSWVNDTASPLPQNITNSASVVYNGYAYELGGINWVGSTGTTLTTAYYSQINNGGPGTIGSWTANTNSLPSGIGNATTVTYNGYIYEIGGYNGTSYLNTVYYAQISSTGSVGVWNTTTVFPSTIYNAASVVYNGYIYEIGGCASTCPTSAVYYALICTGQNSGIGGCSTTPGSIGSWTATSILTSVTEEETAVVYNGYIYETGGSTGGATLTTASYAKINANGTLGTWTTVTSIPIATQNAGSIAYNGYLYVLGGWEPSTGVNQTSAAYYAPINSNGTLGSWAATTNLEVPLSNANTVAYNGYIYMIGGYNGGATNTVLFTSINSNGSLSVWTPTTSLPSPTDSYNAVVYNGYVYQVGGGSTSTPLSSVDYAPFQSIPRVGQYSMLVKLGDNTNVTPTSIVTRGSAVGNPGIGGLANGFYSGLGGITIRYENATTSCNTLSPYTLVDSNSTDASGNSQLITPYKLIFSKDGCSNTVNQGQYAYLFFTLDDSQTATFPDIYSSHTTVTGFNVYYHAASTMRLRGGATFRGNILQSLDAPPLTAQ